MPKTGLDTVASWLSNLPDTCVQGSRQLQGNSVGDAAFFPLRGRYRALPNPGYPVSMFAYALRICVTSTFTFESCRAALCSNCSTVESRSWACFIR